jgi:hypothetical protein
VCWLGGWSRYRLYYLVMVVKIKRVRLRRATLTRLALTSAHRRSHACVTRMHLETKFLRLKTRAAFLRLPPTAWTSLRSGRIVRFGIGGGDSPSLLCALAQQVPSRTIHWSRGRFGDPRVAAYRMPGSQFGS